MIEPTFPSSFNTEPLRKKQFAGFVYQGFSPFLAALKLFPQDNNLAYSKSLEWANDPFVLGELARLKEEADAKLRAPVKEVNRVMVVRDHGTDAEWEAKIAAQQAKLVGHG